MREKIGIWLVSWKPPSPMVVLPVSGVMAATTGEVRPAGGRDGGHEVGDARTVLPTQTPWRLVERA